MPRLLAIVRDITDRKRAELALQESEERYRTIFEEGPLGIVLASLDFEVQYVNQRFCEMLGYSEMEIIALGLAGISHPDDLDTDHQLGLRLLRGELPYYTIDKRYIRKDGTAFWGQLTVSMMHDAEGKPTAMIRMIQDITEHKEIAELLQESEAKYRRLHESMRDAFVSVDMDGFIREYNEAYQQMLGYEPEELLTLRHTDVTPEKWHLFETKIVQQQILPRGHSDIYEKEYRRKDGTIFPVELRTFLIKDDQGQPTAMWAIIRDITERKKTEEALQKAYQELERRVEERTAELRNTNKDLAVFRRFVEASRQGFSMATLNGEIMYVNPAIGRLFAEGRSEDMIGQPVGRYCPEEYMTLREHEIITSVLREGHWEGEITIPHGDESLSCLQNTFLVNDEQGNPACVASVITDITGRKLAEEALRQGRDEFQMIYDNMLEGCVITDIETKRFMRVNAAMCKMLGYSEEELLSMSVTDIHRAGEGADALARIQARAEGNVQEFRNVSVLRKDGSVFYADIIGNTFTYGGRRCIVGLFRDITERKQAEELLAESEEKYRTLVETSPDAVLMLDLGGHITFVSRRLLELFGNDRVEDFLGTSPSESIIQEEQQEFHIHLARTLKEGVVRNVAFTLFRRDGTRFPGEASAALVRDTSGKPTAIIVVLRDITEPKRAEGALRESEEKYKTLVETSPDAVVMSDLTGHITFASRRAAEMYGIEHVEEMLGRNPLEFIDAEAHERYRTNLQTFIEEGIRRDVEYKLVRKDGTRFPGELSGAYSGPKKLDHDFESNPW